MRISFSIKEIRSISADVFKQKEHQKITKDFCSVLTVPNPLCPRSELNNYTLRWLGEGISENQELSVCGPCHTESLSKQTALTSELPKGFKVGSFHQHSARGYGCDGAWLFESLVQVTMEDTTRSAGTPWLEDHQDRRWCKVFLFAIYILQCAVEQLLLLSPGQWMC